MVDRNALRGKVRALKAQTYALYLVTCDARTPWYAKAVAVLTVAYALSPIDLIPDFVPVLGYLDDLVLVPLGLWVAMRLVPHDVLEDARCACEDGAGVPASLGRRAAMVIVALWLLGALLIALMVWRLLGE